MNKSFKFPGLDKVYMSVKNSRNGASTSVILQQAPVGQSCGCCEVCQCELHVGDAAFPDKSAGFFLVYILGPLVGAGAAAAFFLYAFEPASKQLSAKCDCNDGNCEK